MKVKYTVSPKNQIYALSFILGLTIFMVFGGVYFYHKYGYLGGMPLRMGLLFYSIYLLPIVYLHIEYLIYDYRTVLYIDYEDNLFIHIKKKDRLVFHLKDIETITIFEDKNGWFSTSPYSYASIHIKERGNPIIVTSLLLRKFLTPLRIKKEKIQYMRRIIPSPFLERYL